MKKLTTAPYLYLVTQRWDVSHGIAYRYIKSKRRPSHKVREGPNAGFRAQLCSWKAQLLRVNSAAIYIEAEVPNGEDVAKVIREGLFQSNESLQSDKALQSKKTSQNRMKSVRLHHRTAITHAKRMKC